MAEEKKEEKKNEAEIQMILATANKEILDVLEKHNLDLRIEHTIRLIPR